MKQKKIFQFIIAACFIIFNTSAAQNFDDLKEDDNCVSCHSDMEIMPEGFLPDNIHMQKGLSCSGCHGGDPATDDMEISMSEDNGFIGVPDRADIPGMCGKCHSNIEFMRTFRPQIQTDQVSQYFTSMHGIKLKEGDENVAECASCHTAHSILPAKDPRSTIYPVNIPETCNKCHGDQELMSNYNIEATQYKEYSKSVHGIALLENKDAGAPACNDCHGNHGAMPPEITSISHVCGTCHVNNMNLFESSDMAKGFSQLDYHACEQCHGYHNIQEPGDFMIGDNEESVCTDCHFEDDEGMQVAVSIKNILTDFVSVYDTAEAKLHTVQVKGMNDLEIEYLLKEARQKLIESRTAIHSFDPAKVKEISKAGVELTQKAIKDADSEMDEYYTRREGFIFASVALLVFGIAIFLRIRLISKDKG
ncbi:MAG: cytochrome c3 family protein [Melioribacteraceae bacterium]|nr:cytochrome c3 family protein [Melioribacteraceae bacterium]MCF8355578.1 cytochrome c3 family protein [Melioribacteraceae bacterium]MCF8395043.1 cytochrome c3 family protein [Melioribacteraceae bacterium]MCF8420497.1 cytochrome c3 family protein [Melioribacteraceae bacterium]